MNNGRILFCNRARTCDLSERTSTMSSLKQRSQNRKTCVEQRKNETARTRKCKNRKNNSIRRTQHAELRYTRNCKNRKNNSIHRTQHAELRYTRIIDHFNAMQCNERGKHAELKHYLRDTSFLTYMKGTRPWRSAVVSYAMETAMATES